MPSIEVEVQTDEQGYFHRRQINNPPGFLSIRVALEATLLAPADTEVSGTLDIDATDGSPSNQAKQFKVSTGEKVHLGSWRLDGGDNIIVLSGKTQPVRANATLRVRLDASL